MDKRDGLMRWLFGVAFGLALVAALGGCKTTPEVMDGPPLLATGPFRHEAHLVDSEAIREGNGGALLECKSCHSVDARFAVQRPGAAQHAPCDTCHNDAFNAQPGALCTSCHTSVDPRTAGKSPLHAYPGRERVAQLLANFDHKLHLNGSKVKTPKGGLSCDTCHKVAGPEEAYASFPTHAACFPCHGPAAAKADGVVPVLDNCQGCHAQDGPGKARRFVTNDIRFTHGKHVADKAGKGITCEMCHYAVKQSAKSSDIVLPAMADCATCHADAGRTPDRVRMDQCGVCHTSAIDSKKLPGNHTASLGRGAAGVLAAQLGGSPADDGPALTLADFTPNGEPLLADKDGVVPVDKGQVNPNKRPEDHTPIYRTRHAQAASSRDAKCGYCHEGLSGSVTNNCNECHAIMRPMNHNLRFRSSEHGRVAAADATRCATCHEVDYCTECHQIAPSNHSPLAGFRYRHERVARLNARSCMTCHTFESTCRECHTGTIGTVRSPIRSFERRLR